MKMMLVKNEELETCNAGGHWGKIKINGKQEKEPEENNETKILNIY